MNMSCCRTHVLSGNYEESNITYTQMLASAWEKNGSRILASLQKLVKKLEEKLLFRQQSTMKVLSIGCGIGYELDWLFKNGYTNLYGIDINPRSLDVAKRNCPQAHLRYGDVYKIPFETNSIDLVLLIEVIEHLDCPTKALGEIYRVLKPDGVLLLTTPNRMGLMGLSNGPVKFITQGYWYKSVFRILGFLTCGPEHVKEYFSFELARVLKLAGFYKIIFPQYTFFPFYPAGKYYLIAQKLTH